MPDVLGGKASIRTIYGLGMQISWNWIFDEGGDLSPENPPTLEEISVHAALRPPKS